MDSSQRNKLILGGVLILALAAVAVYMYSDVLFPEHEKPVPAAAAATDDGAPPPVAAAKPSQSGEPPAAPPAPAVSGGKMLMPKR